MDDTYFVFNIRVRPVIEEQLHFRLVAQGGKQYQRRFTLLQEKTQPRSHAIADTHRKADKHPDTHRTPPQPSYTTLYKFVCMYLYLAVLKYEIGKGG